MVIFIVGYSRSGTKMINEVLKSMGVSDVIQEVHFFEQIYNFRNNDNITNYEIIDKLIFNVKKRSGNTLPNGMNIQDLKAAVLKEIKENEISKPVDVYLTFLKSMNSASCSLDPTPRNAYFIRNIKEHIPDAKFLYMVRDPRDCVLSQSKKWYKYLIKKKKPLESLRLFVNYHPALMSIFWNNSFNEYEKAKQNHEIKKDILLLRYEDAISNPYMTAEHISEFLGIDLQPDLNLDYINPNNSLKWVKGLSKSKTYLIEKNVRSKLVELDYPINIFSIRDKIVGNIYNFFYFLKYPFILLFNFNRSKNLWASFRLRVLGK